MTVPAVALFAAAGLARQFDLVHPGQFAVPHALHGLSFVLSAAAALAAPVFIRTLFAHSTRGQTRVSAQRFLGFQRRILWAALSAPYFACMAYFCDFPRFYAGAILLLAMYAVYYHFPSERRISFDRKIFKVK